MRVLAFSATLLAAAASASAQTSATLDVVVSDVPASATEVMVVADFVPATPAPSADAPPRRQRQRRAAPPAIFTQSVAVDGANVVRVRLAVAPAPNFRVRAVAVSGGGPMRLALAGAGRKEVAIAADATIEVALALTRPTLALAPGNPTVVEAGATFTLAGIVTDPGGCLEGKGRMRVWSTAGAPATENFAGRQTSTIDTTQEGDNITFAVELTAPPEPTTLFCQFGELSPLFSGDDGTRAVFLVVPDLAAGERPAVVRVDAAAPSVAGAK